LDFILLQGTLWLSYSEAINELVCTCRYSDLLTLSFQFVVCLHTLRAFAAFADKREGLPDLFFGFVDNLCFDSNQLYQCNTDFLVFRFSQSIHVFYSERIGYCVKPVSDNSCLSTGPTTFEIFGNNNAENHFFGSVIVCQNNLVFSLFPIGLR